MIPGDIQMKDLIGHNSNNKNMAKLGMIQYEIGVNEAIIRMIENEQILDLQEAIRDKRKHLQD